MLLRRLDGYVQDPCEWNAWNVYLRCSNCNYRIPESVYIHTYLLKIRGIRARTPGFLDFVFTSGAALNSVCGKELIVYTHFKELHGAVCCLA